MKKNRTIISVDTARQLKDWGCGIDLDSAVDYHSLKHGKTFIDLVFYDLADIITNQELANAFFGEKFGAVQCVFCGLRIVPVDVYPDSTCSICMHTQELALSLRKNKRDEAEKYLLDHCVFNPKNR